MNTKKYYCTNCEKYYKTSQSLCNHKRKFHNNSPLTSLETLQNTTNLPQKPTNLPQKSTNLPQNTTKNKLECIYCKKILSRYDSLKRHENNCKYKHKIKEDNTNLKEEIEQLKFTISNILKQSKIHPKTLQKINKQLINNNTNNGTINNTINIVKFGSENIKDILNEKEIIHILNQHYSAIEESIKTVHFNNKRPEYKNIYITNLRDNLAYIYNGNNYEAVQKTSVINKLIDDHVYNIEVSLENYKHKLSERSAKVLEKLIEKINDEQTKINDYNHDKEYKNFKAFKINEIKLLIYNESKNAELIRLKYNN
jgi:hypothetical protein